ncbi:stalk domain-containing protein [Paenibacillus harenae]|uniref:Copper amine oxidase-like N-terminal domain-containing protein n=1 Tax=Paenibacillus harenae TaxID=306543 RepID=A0ABT9TZI4_PAEHA|nr:stalk domain-containing protein [Paenibacillus harenae]MDQ0112792.1 hypothetical protein [Paenibacillus harenae]
MNNYFKKPKLFLAAVLTTLMIFPTTLYAGTESNTRYLNNIVQISTSSFGDTHALALDQNGVVWAWGDNFSGQVGDGTTGYKSAAVPVLQDAQKIETSDTNSFALKKDGTVWVWGQATGLQGNGTLNSISGIKDFVKPTQIKTLTNVVDIQAGSYHILALKSDGTVWSWGDANLGKLGRSEWKQSITKANTPMMVPGLQNIKSIYAGDGFSAATDEAGITWAWGVLSSYFDIIDNVVSKWEPVKLFDFPVTEIDDMSNRIYVTKSDGTLWEVQKTLKIKQVMKDVLTFSCGHSSCAVIKTTGDTVKFNDAAAIQKIGLVIKPNELKQIDFNYSTLLLLLNGTVHSYGRITSITGNEMINDPDYNKYANLTNKMATEPHLRPVWKAITLNLNDSEAKLTTNPIVIKGVSFVPLRGVIEEMGGQVQYDNGDITIWNDRNKIKLKIRTTAASINGQNTTLTAPPLVIRGKTMVPLRFIGEGLGASVEWDEENRVISIKTEK